MPRTTKTTPRKDRGFRRNGDGEQNELAPTYPRGLEVQSPVMTDNKVVPFPTPDVSLEPEPISKRHRRVIFSIGTQRLAMDFYCQVTELNPTPAPVIPVDRGKPRKFRKSLK